MIKYLLSILSFHLLLPGNGFSQIKLGFTSGVNFSYQRYEFNQYGNNSKRLKMMTGFNGGILAKIPLSSMIRFQPSFQLSQKGAKDSWIIDNGIYEKEETLTYIEIQVPAHYLLNKLFFIGAGPVIGVASGGKITYNVFPDEDPFEIQQQRFDAGLLFQTGYELRQFQLSLAFNLGIVNQYKSDPRAVALFNRTFSVCFAYFLRK